MKISRKIVLFTTFCLAIYPMMAFSQESGNLTAEQRVARMQDEIDLLKKQQDLEKAKSDLANQRLAEILNALPKNSSIKTLEGKSEFKDAKEADPQTVVLSYEALKEISAQISETMRSKFSPYSRIVIYDESDFLSLAKYRVYRSQSRIALRNYDLLAQTVEKLDKENRIPNTGKIGRFGTKSIDPVTMALSLPTIGSSTARSVAELFSVFRTDTSITQTSDTIDTTSLPTVMANELSKNNPALKIYYPQAFVPEYDLETEGDDSLFVQISQVAAANTYLGEFVGQLGKISESERGASPLKETATLAEVVKKQLQSLTIGEASTTKTSADIKANMTEFRQMIRAEKLDRFMRGGNSQAKNFEESSVGILKLRVLASGGSRRETRNLFLGSKVSYSGSAVIEVLLFDMDGTLRASEVFSFHTGFRQMKPNEKNDENFGLFGKISSFIN